MRRTKLLAVMMALLLVFPYGVIGIGGSVSAANTNNQRYYYSQLDSVAKGIYDAMYKMYEQGIFQTGTQEYDLIANGHIKGEQLAAYNGRQDEILKLFGAARDAFYADYPDIFYVDFSKLSISMTIPDAVEDGDNFAAYQASLGIGGDSTYFVEGFSDKQQVVDAIKAHEDTIRKIADDAKKSGSVREQVAYVYKAILDITEYRLDTNCDKGNEGHVRTSYGALVKGQSLCEGYARAVKAVLDSMGIKSVLVQGYYCAPDGSDNLHMWNYVQIDGKWYGLDATAGDGMKGAVERDKYLLADKTVMDANHRPDGVMSDSGFRFTYPQLAAADESPEEGEETPDEEGTDKEETDKEETDSSGYKTLFDKEGFVVQYRDGTASEGDVGVFKASYKGMGYQDAVDKEGVYMLTRFYQYMPGNGTYEVGSWGYSDPKPFAMPQLKDALVLANGNSRYIEFAITKKAPAGPLYGDGLTTEDLEKNWKFQGTDKDFIASTGKLDNPKGTFVPSPFARKVTPSNSGYLTCGKTYHVTLVFNEQLVKIEGEKLGYEVTVTDGVTGAEKSVIKNLKWDGDRTVEFDFTPSDQEADNYAGYTFQITGLQGKGSLKAPDGVTFFAKIKRAICAYRSEGIYLNLGAKPQLLEPSDIFCGDWVNDHGEQLKNVKNIVLTASKPELKVETPGKSQTDTMVGMIKDEVKSDGYTVEKSATYDLRLMTCNQNVIQTGMSVRLHIGFPEGFGPDDEGVTFKAYHFIKKDGQITGVEELECIVGEKGLIVTCYSFSPFAIVALSGGKAQETTDQKLLVMSSAGGDVKFKGDDKDRICTLSEKGQSKTVEIKANPGYVISGVYLNDKGQKVTNKSSMNVTVKYEALDGESNILDVVFAKDSPQSAALSTPDKSSDTTQQSSSSGGQSSSSGGQSSSSGSGSSTSSSSSAATGSAADPSGTKTNDAAADNLPFVVLPQGSADAAVTDQASAAPIVPSAPSAPAVPSTSSTNITGNITTDGNAGAISSGQGDGVLEVIGPDAEPKEEHLVLSTGENSMDLVVLPADGAGSDKEESGLSKTLLTVVVCAAAAGMIAVAVVGFVQIRRD